MDVMGENVDLMAEKTVIGSLLGPEGYEIWVDISDIIVPNTFIADTHQVVYKCLNEIYKENPDIKKINYPLVLNKSKVLGFGDFLDKKDEKAYLKEVAKNVSDKSNVRVFAKKLRKLEIARIIREQIAVADLKLKAVTGDESASDILNMVEGPLLDFSRMVHGFEGQNTEPLFGNIEEWVQNRIDNPKSFVGFKTGWDAMDLAIGGGIRPGTVNVIASRFGQGKSSAGENIGMFIATDQKVPVLLLDTEMSKEERLPRDLAMMSMVSITEIEQGSFAKNPVKVKMVKEAAQKLKEIAHIYDYRNICGMEFDQVISVMKNWVLTKVGLNSEGFANPCVVILDYLKLQSSSGMTNNIAEHQLLGFLITAYVNFCQKYKVGGLTFAQVNREGIKSEESDVIASSDKINWFAASCIFMKMQSEEEIQAQRDMGIQDIYDRKLIILKSRHGPGLDRDNYINLRFRRHFCKMECGPCQFNLVNETRLAGQDGEITND